jgi:hypothetical protein
MTFGWNNLNDRHDTENPRRFALFSQTTSSLLRAVSIRKDDDSRMRRRQQQATTMSMRNTVSLDIETNGDDQQFLVEPKGKSSFALSPRSYSSRRRIYIGGSILVVSLILWLSQTTGRYTDS